MRPIHLQIAGLQSYRELQTIDFSRLCEAGVFGIFGPTGSGKSSILDAITLSLYGKVERASGGTQAIMNHAEQTLFVSFTFELTNAAGTERYKVERQFKRGSEFSINNTISRLMHIRGEETIVLADKAGEVNQQVQGILGLSMQDFTRAVVLPQGKFAEFLTLTGKDRRQMLQRLFHLEQYGDQLSAKVSGKVKETDVQVKQLAAEQQGLGDASEQALEEAKAKLVQAEQEAQLSRERLQRQELIYDEQRQVFLWQQEQSKLEKEAAELQGHEPFIREKELQLQKAEQAERIRPYLEQHREAGKEVQVREQQLKEAESAQTNANEAYEKAQSDLAQAESELTVQEGPLLLRLDQLQQALELQRELDQLQAQTGDVTAQEAAVKERLAGLRAELQKNQETKEKALVKQAELKEQLKLAETGVELRQKLQNAYQEKKATELLQTQERDWQRVREEKSKALDAWTQSWTQASSKRGLLLERLHGWGEEIVNHEKSLRQEKASVSGFLDVVQAAVQKQKLAWKEQERHALAALLSEGLIAGEACPVCGSTHHPDPLRTEGHRSEVSEGKSSASEEAVLTGLEELQQGVKELLYTIQQQLQNIMELRRRGVELSLTAARKEAEAWTEAAVALAVEEAEAEHAGTPDMRDLDPAYLQEVYSGFIHRMEENKTCLNGFEHDFSAIQRELQLLDQQLAQAEAQRQAAETAWNEAGHKLADVSLSLKRQLEQWHSRYAEIGWETLEEQLERQLEKDRLAEELRGRIEKSIPFLEGLFTRIEELQQAALEQDKTALQLHERLQGLAQLAADKSRQLAQRAAGADVPQLIAEASAALQQLRSRAQQTKLAHGEAQREQQLAAQRYSAAAEAAAAAVRQLAQAERALQAALAESGFASREAAEAAALAPELRREWAELAAAHREQEQTLRAGLAQLAAKLQGRELSAAEWEATQALLRAAKEQAEAALEARAKAAQGAEELAARHARWSELEARRAEQAALLERLGKLQTVLKANAFVEYLAEEQLMQVSRAASERLGQLTRRRYAIEVDSGGGFVIRDDANGGVKRPVSTLSGGETFLTSLALALALSAQIQLKGEYPLEFFFLDEGFGTLDQELLDMVVGALEKLHMDSLAVGVISHVPELRARLPRKLVVHPAEPSGRGSRIVLEEL